MAKIPRDERAVIMDGYLAGLASDNPYLPTSTMWERWELGRWLDSQSVRFDVNALQTRRGSVIEIDWKRKIRTCYTPSNDYKILWVSNPK